ncbi:MAG: DNA-directed RNA polymerase subunit alpha C-terminal domain-containing protein [Planctomycetota bacterium]
MTDTTVQEAPIFDIAHSDIPSFGALQAPRAVVFQNRRNYDAFERAVEGLETTGEPGRRRGIGYWILGKYAESAAQLAAYADDDVASFTRARSLSSIQRFAEAAAVFERLAAKYPGEPRPRGGMLDARFEEELAKGDTEAAVASLRKALDAESEAFRASAEGRYLLGRVAESSFDADTALEHYLASRTLDPTHRGNLFRLAYLSERSGLDRDALEVYQTLASMLPIDRAAAFNLGMLYEDLGREHLAAACYDTIVRSKPQDRRARLYLGDARAGMEMYYDEDMERKEDRLNQILRIPITDFELSVRARNCLNKMDIMSLGDLVKRTEAELLSYKNFGETSLAEIKEILQSKGLRLGMGRDEAVRSIAKVRSVEDATVRDPHDPRNKPVAELKLSIRARRTVENLGCLSLGDVTQHAEDELLGMPNFGVTSLLELKNKLAEYGLKLKGDD